MSERDQYGEILVTVRQTVPGTTETVWFDWHGGPVVALSGNMRVSPVARFIFGDWKLDGRLWVGPFRLRIIETPGDPINQYWLAIRDDPLWRVRLTLHKLSHALEIVYRRLIMTAAVWKLADIIPGTIPSYRDLRLYRRLKK